MKSIHPLLWAFVSLNPIACGPGAVGEAVRPDDVSFAEARGPAAPCSLKSDYAEPLIVDMKPEHRGDLEVAMKRGVAVVSYDCNSLRVLPDCHAAGGYGFVGMSRKEQVIRLNNADELQANLPFSGAKLGGALERGNSFDIALMMVGKQMAPHTTVPASQLDGRCDGATHFVRGATLGAFAMTQGSAGKVRTAAEIFGFGAEASSESERREINRDGDLGACKKASSSDERPVDDCAALVRLELTKIGGSADAQAGEALAASLGVHCPEGFVFAEGKCSRPSPDRPHACKLGDGRDCLEQCDKGDATSCVFLGVMYARGHGVPRNGKKAVELLSKACEGGHTIACGELAIVLFTGEAVERDAARAKTYFEGACESGHAKSCGNLAAVYWTGMGAPKDRRRAAELVARACKSGDARSCANYAGLLYTGLHVKKDLGRARELAEASCEAKDDTGCANLGLMYFYGIGVEKDESRGATLLQSSCDVGFASACGYLATAYHLGRGAESDVEQALSYARSACDKRASQCASYGVIMLSRLMGGAGVQLQKACPELDGCDVLIEADASCAAGEYRACTIAGALRWRHDQDDEALSFYDKGCKLGDPTACGQAKRLREQR